MAKYIVGDIFRGDYQVSQYYGNNPAYYKQFGFNGHEGVDWATPVGVEILAPFKRNVILQDQDDPKSGAYGDYIVVWDPEQKCAIWYCHLSINNVENGKEYKKGTVLGKTGNTGNSTGPHLHVNFVETDVNGVRQNTGNGFKGMLNILDSNLVEWKLGDEQATIPVENQQAIIDQLRKERDTNWNLYSPFKDAGYENVDKVKAEIKSKQDTIDNLNQQINDRNNDITQLNSKLNTAEQTINDLTVQRNSAQEQAKLVPDLVKENEAMKHDKSTWQAQDKAMKNKIDELTKENKELKEQSVSALVKVILNKVFRIS